ncbi:MAG: shikimate dehydrogenase [Candidatus Lokiarchaeota archaeon]|nr:shikimate dehydrogenase [Candidatus Lokiarchaeota archaeon]
MFDQLKNSTRTNIICIFGHPIEHSMSPIMHNIAFKDLGLDYIYIAIDIAPNNLKQAFDVVRALDIKGANITVPHKKRTLQYVDEISPIARKIGAINTIKNEDGKLIGTNTDASGAKKALKEANIDINEKNVMILGAGGAARALAHSLIEETNNLFIVNRTSNRGKNLARELTKEYHKEVLFKKFKNKIFEEKLPSIDILVNTTTIGMFPDIHISPIPKNYLHDDLTIFDIIYNPLETQLMKDASEKGCRVLGGLDMLIYQGVLSFEWWTNQTPNVELMKKSILDELEVK